MAGKGFRDGKRDTRHPGAGRKSVCGPAAQITYRSPATRNIPVDAALQPTDMVTLQNTAANPRAIRLPEVENAVMDALDDRGVRAGQIVPLVEIEVAMDARGYSFRWVRRAINSLMQKGALRFAGASMVQRLGVTPAPGKRGKHYRLSSRRRATLAKL